jgi:formylglycine-generating enzyme required for sulfatase activity
VSAQTKFRLSVTEIIAPAITTQPLAVAINSGETATLTVAASGSESTFQWYIGNSGVASSPVGGATSASFTTPALTATTTYWVRASNRAGTVDSNAATVTVNSVIPTGFALIPSGSFTMGDALDGGGDAHTVTVSAFYMAKNLVT